MSLRLEIRILHCSQDLYIFWYGKKYSAILKVRSFACSKVLLFSAHCRDRKFVANMCVLLETVVACSVLLLVMILEVRKRENVRMRIWRPRQGPDTHYTCVVFTNARAVNFHYKDNLDSLH